MGTHAVLFAMYWRVCSLARTQTNCLHGITRPVHVVAKKKDVRSGKRQPQRKQAFLKPFEIAVVAVQIPNFWRSVRSAPGQTRERVPM